MCLLCHKTFSAKTSLTTPIRHLKLLHNFTKALVSNVTDGKTDTSLDVKPAKRQSTLNAIKITGELEERYNSGLVIYLAEGGLLHIHMESKELKRLLQMLQPGYKLKLARTAKRRLLKLYALMKLLLCDYLSSILVRISITFDPLTNTNYRGYYSTTLHFATSNGSLHETMLGFFIKTGPGAGKQCASKIFDCLCSFQIADKLLATVMDNVSDAIKGADTLAELLERIW